MVENEELAGLEFAADGTVSPQWAAKIASHIHNDRTAKQGTVTEFVSPLTLLLLMVNDENSSAGARFAAAREAAPYLHRKVTDRPLNLNLGQCKNAAQILKAQRLVIAAIGRGEVVPAEGRQMIEALAIMAHTLETTSLEAQLAAEEAAPINHRPSLVVFPGGQDLPIEDAS